MSLDAQDWVWEHSQSKGVARTVLLAIADKATGKDCSAYAGSTFLMRRANASKSAIRAALDALRTSGELKVVVGRKGPQGETRYRLPKAVDHRRLTSETTHFGGGVESDPQGQIQEPPGGTGSQPRGGTGSKPRGGTESDPRNAVHAVEQKASRGDGDAAPGNIPDFARPLVDGLTANGVIVRWPFTSNEWLRLHAVIKRVGIAAMVEFARKVAARTPVESARYFAQGWNELPPIPAADTARPPLRTVPTQTSSADLTPEELRVKLRFG